jgi:hypothetical protein
MKKLILALGLFAVVLLGTVTVNAAKTDSCAMCATGTVCAMCDSLKHCVLTVKGKDAKYCCGFCEDMKVSKEDCKKQCDAVSSKN